MVLNRMNNDPASILSRLGFKRINDSLWGIYDEDTLDIYVYDNENKKWYEFTWIENDEELIKVLQKGDRYEVKAYLDKNSIKVSIKTMKSIFYCL